MPQAEGGTVLARLARWCVRHRWGVLAGWLLATVLAVLTMPTLGSVVQNDTTAFLPPNAPSVQAVEMAETFAGAKPQLTGTLVMVTSDGPLTTPDQRAFDAVEVSARRVPGVLSVRDEAVSPDGRARTASVDFAPATDGGGPAAARAVNGLRALLERTLPPGAEGHLTGALPQLVDQQRAGSRTATRVEVLSVALVLLLLLLAFRSLLAPLVTLAPPALALALAGPLVAESTRVGVQISSLLQLLMTALVLGAGTDYGLFLLFRYREHLRAGMEPGEALVTAVRRVGRSVTFSALTVVAALSALVLASFGLYRGVGPGLALAVVVVLLVELTLFPALLAVIGRAVFWPVEPVPGPPRTGAWGALARRVCRRPVTALVVGVAVLAGLSLGLRAYQPSGFNPGGYISGSDSDRGEAVLAEHFGPAVLGSTEVLFRLPVSAWQRPDQIAEAHAHLALLGRFSSIADAVDLGRVTVDPGTLVALRDRLGPPNLLPAQEPPGSDVDPDLYQAYRATAEFVSPDGRTVLFRTSLLAGPPGSTAAMQSIPELRTAVTAVGNRLGASRSAVAGQAPGASDVSAISGADMLGIAPLVLLVLGILLAVLLRSLVAPLYLVASVALSYAASLGLAVLVFQVLGTAPGTNFTLPFFLFVFIMALGEDYNILLMSRVREEAARAPVRAAVSSALGTTGSTITSAGLVLASTFAVLAVATSGQIRQIGTGLALGILIDTFVVRTLLVPSAVVLLGRWNWWPSRWGHPPLPETSRRQPVTEASERTPGRPPVPAEDASHALR